MHQRPPAGPFRAGKSLFRYHVPAIILAVAGPTALCIYALAVWGLAANLGLNSSFPWSTGPLSNWMIWFGLALVANLGAFASPSNSSTEESRTPATAIARIAGKRAPSLNRAAYFWRESRVSSRALVGIAALFVVTSACEARASEPVTIVSATPPALTFARYIAFLNRRDVFSESGPVVVEVSAEIPLQHTHASLSAVRETGTSERSEYEVLGVDGDATLLQAVIERYLTAKARAEDLPCRRYLSLRLTTNSGTSAHTTALVRLCMSFRSGLEKPEQGLLKDNSGLIPRPAYLFGKQDIL
jgi:hypothetical protein